MADGLSVSDFVNLLPSVMAAGFGPGRQEVYFRGIVPAGGGYEATGYYIDDMPITTAGAGITNGLPDHPTGDFPDRAGDGYDPAVILDLDYWAFMPK